MIKIHDTAKVSENCDIEDSVRGSVIEIGAFSNIDSFVKIKPAGGSGNIKLGKRVHINSCCVLYSGNGILIGNNVSIGGQAGVSGHLKIGNNVRIGGGSGVINDLEDNVMVMGYPARDIRKFLKENK